MRAVCAWYDDPDTAQRAVDALAGAGLSREDLEVRSSEPFDQYAFGRDEGTWMPWLAVLGGVVGGSCGFALTSTAQTSWPIETGGMPVVTMWTNSIIGYELTMLGAILATLVTFLATTRSFRRQRVETPAVGEGQILICVTNPRGHAPDELVRRLREIGAVNVTSPRV